MAKKKASAKKSNVTKIKKSKVNSKAKVKTKSSVKKSAKKSLKQTGKGPVKKAKKKSVVNNNKSKKPTVTKKTAKKGAASFKAPDLSQFVTPLDDRLIVQTAGVEKMTAGGLYIPDSVGDVSGNLQGFVLAVGRGHLGKKGHVLPMDVKVGDKVVFSEHAGSKIKIQNQDLIILRESDVLGVISK